MMQHGSPDLMLDPAFDNFDNKADRRRRQGHWQPTSVTTLGGILVGDGRVAACASE